MSERPAKGKQRILPGFEEDAPPDTAQGNGPARIRGIPIAAFFPEHGGPVHALLYGEAPGPRGADKSGIPFWGDGAGVPLYRAMVAAGCAQVPEGAWKEWDGQRFQDEGLRPKVYGVALSNAFPVCPSDDAVRFRAPKRAELLSAENLERLRKELGEGRHLGAARVVTLGKCAADTLTPLAQEAGMEVVRLVHPSAQGLLSEAPGRGRGQRLADLQAAWEQRLRNVLSR